MKQVKYTWVAGVDEAGRGPLAGPVIAAAVILKHPSHIHGLDDSKRLSQRKRESLFGEIKDKALAWSIGRAEVEEIDTINIHAATLQAMRRAVLGLATPPERVLVDGTHCPLLDVPTEAIIAGDKKVPAISAASIIAKVTRDAEMIAFDDVYPGYGFAVHKGYPTKQHLNALKTLGVSKIHRKSYAPVRVLLSSMDAETI